MIGKVQAQIKLEEKQQQKQQAEAMGITLTDQMSKTANDFGFEINKSNQMISPWNVRRHTEQSSAMRSTG